MPGLDYSSGVSLAPNNSNHSNVMVPLVSLIVHR